ncbi:cytidylate kinase-like family protein [Puteibacter caeruleilacunae]|nr:cytidylate kinase-like family protein [Puteibacter caeruleilacunae]
MKHIFTGMLKESDRILGKKPGPVITISRECGCSAKRIATKLSKILTGYSFRSDTKTDIQWRWVSKEIIEGAAEQLEMDPNRILNVFQGERKIRVHDIVTAFSTEKVYDSDDLEVIDTVSDTIRAFAEQGNYIIVGRGGVVHAKGISNALNIKLQAPLDWRISQIMQISNMSKSEAREYVLNVDRERDLFVEHLAGRPLNSCDFDLIFNYSTMLDDHIVDAIVNVLKNKEII